MATTRNLLEYNNALLRYNDKTLVELADYQNNWLSSNSVLNLISSNFYVDSRYVLEIFPSSAAPITVYLNGGAQLYLEDNGTTISFNMKVKASSPVNVATKIYIGDPSGVEAYQQSLSSGQYNAIQSNRLDVPDNAIQNQVFVEIVISDHAAAPIYLTCPHIIDEFEFYQNPFVAFMRNYFPDFYWELDSQKTQPTYPFFRLLDILSSAAGDTQREYNEMYGFESDQLMIPDEATLSWAQSSLVSPRAVREDYVNWLAQFTGEPIHRNFQLSDGSPYFDNAGLRRDFIEWQLLGSHYGRAAGTRSAMLEAAKQVLIKTKNGNPTTRSVALTPRYQGDPFAIRIQTLTNETIDADNGESSDIVLQSVNLAKPLGYSISHLTVDEFYLTLDDPVLGLLDGSLSWA